MGLEHSTDRNQNRLVSSDEKMSHVVKNNYSALRFHPVCGENVKLSQNRTVACRSEGFCKGIVFSDRPISILEPVYVKFLEVSPNWSGALRIGFTMNDPQCMKSKVPKYACPDLTSIHGNWAKAVGEKLAKRDSILYFYVDTNGDVHYGVDREEYGIFFGGVNTSGKLWAVLDIYGNTVAVEFIDPKFFNRCQNDSSSNLISYTTDLEERTTMFKPIAFHRIHGQNITFGKDRSILCRKPSMNVFSCAFTERPIEVGQKIALKVLKVAVSNGEPFTYGITACDPSALTSGQLPENPYDLIDRPEYWVVTEKKFDFNVGDFITFTITPDGQLKVIFNEEPNSYVTFVDKTLPLWLFFNLTSRLLEVQILSTSSILSPDKELADPFSSLNIEEADNIRPSSSGQQSTSECVICYERSVDCAVYRCGHMCMCHECASKLFNTTCGQCPICRKPISDILKIYK